MVGCLFFDEVVCDCVLVMKKFLCSEMLCEGCEIGWVGWFGLDGLFGC